jgi:hypothetical protein
VDSAMATPVKIHYKDLTRGNTRSFGRGVRFLTDFNVEGTYWPPDKDPFMVGYYDPYDDMFIDVGYNITMRPGKRDRIMKLEITPLVTFPPGARGLVSIDFTIIEHPRVAPEVIHFGFMIGDHQRACRKITCIRLFRLIN